MKTPPAFQFYPGDWLSSSRVQAMSIEAEGVYIRLLCYQWQDGSIPDDIQTLSRLSKISLSKMKGVWKQVAPCFDLAMAPGRIANKRLETVRNQQFEYRNRQAEHGKHGADIKKGSLKGSLEGTAKGNASTSPSSSPSPSSLSPKGNIGKGEGDLPTTEKRVGVPDPAYEVFAEKHREFLGTAYVNKAADFVHLSKLRKANSLESRGTPEKWGAAILNYFDSPLTVHTLADLCSRFATFVNSPIDRYGKPVNHRGNGNGKHNDAEDIARYNREGAIEFDKQLFGPAWDGSEPESN